MSKRRADPGSADHRIVSLGILGPVEGWNARGRPVRITPGLARMLVLLLESANEAVRADVLRDQLWPGDDREDSTALLHTNVCTLRNLFGRDADESLTPALLRRGSGYELRVGPLQLDWFRHKRLCDAATRAIADQRHADAKRYLVDARRLWRGEALLGLSDDFMEPFVGHIKAAQAEASLQLVDVGLALGEHHELIPLLRHLTGRYPLDEALASRLMIALFRSGRQAEALEVYDSCRHKLADAGLVPTPQLTGTEIEILTRDPAVMAPDASRAGALPRWSISGTVLVGTWRAVSPPPWAYGDAELLLIAEDEGGELLRVEGSSLVARFEDVDGALGAAVRIQRGLKARGSTLGRFVVHDGSRAATRGARLLELCERLVADAENGQILAFRSVEVPDQRVERGRA